MRKYELVVIAETLGMILYVSSLLAARRVSRAEEASSLPRGRQQRSRSSSLSGSCCGPRHTPGWLHGQRRSVPHGYDRPGILADRFRPRSRNGHVPGAQQQRHVGTVAECWLPSFVTSSGNHRRCRRGSPSSPEWCEPGSQSRSLSQLWITTSEPFRTEQTEDSTMQGDAPA